ncbi:DUF2585 family protein [Roseomonas marmotae]|uniref:DUF2585 family protein n=1 Tax=Roseomonas marmotae TaxID=2768161 RepID=A0ABS3K8Y0_9PROT|nr:DUF2585 family protein [Roseomonas marmotae]MBO1073472.1 DUF2585 family protein [Roseomonas marmotae]QTI80335.1 DUF2585 family protein [Roseomonas marmotae]
MHQPTQFPPSPAQASAASRITLLERWRRRRRPAPPPCSWPVYLTAMLLVMGTTWVVMLAMGRQPLAPDGSIRLWGRLGPGNSQQFLDWYSLLHIIYGIGWAGILWLTSRHWPRGWLLVVALMAAAGWEMAENTPFVILRYGSTGADPGYAGDSLVNATGDMLCVLAGFLLATRLGLWRGVLLAVGLELLVTFMIRDGLVLGSIMLLHPVEAVRAWHLNA